MMVRSEDKQYVQAKTEKANEPLDGGGGAYFTALVFSRVGFIKSYLTRRRTKGDNKRTVDGYWTKVP